MGTSLAAASLVTTKAGYTMSPMAVTVISNAPLAAFAYVMIAPVKTINEINKNKDVGVINSFPFVSFIGNCGVWSAYGILCGDPTVLIANGCGFLAGCYFTYSYQKYATIPMAHWGFAGGMNVIAIGAALGMDTASA
eukprot:UN28294